MKIIARDAAILAGVALFAWVVAYDPTVLYAFGGGVCLGLSGLGVCVVIHDLYRYLRQQRERSVP